MVAHRANRDVTGKEKKTFLLVSLDYIHTYTTSSNSQSLKITQNVSLPNFIENSIFSAVCLHFEFLPNIMCTCR